MPVRKDTHGEWFFRTVVRLPDGTRRRISGWPGTPGPYHDLGRSKVGAQAAEERGKDIARGLAAPPFAPKEEAAPTIKEYAETFLSTYKPESKPSEKRSRKWIIEARLIPAFGRLRLDAIKQQDVDAFVGQELQRGVSRKTINNRLGVLASLLRYWSGKRDIGLRCNIGGQPGKIEAVPMADVDQLVKVGEPLLVVAVLLGAEAGLRAGEMRGLQWTDLRAGQLTVRRALDTDTGEVIAPKHDKTRDVPISPRLAAALDTLPKRGLWVLAREDGEALDHRVDLYLPVVRLYKRAGVSRPKAPLHGLRHCFGSTMAAAGVPLPVLKELMGHSKVETTMRYIDVNEGQKRDAISAVFGSAARSWQPRGIRKDETR
jgi:integrase